MQGFFDKNGKEIKEGMLLNGGVEYASLWGFPKFQIGNYIDEYSDASTQRGKNLLDAICKKLHLASLAFQSLEGLIRAIGLDKDKLCTYCWNKKE